MLLERSAALLPRLVLCLALLAATAGFAQGSEAPPSAGAPPAEEAGSPPLVPAGEAPEEPAPRGELFPREQEEDTGGAARFAGRLLLQPPVGILAGALGGLVGVYPSFAFSAVICEVILDTRGTTCLEILTYSGTALSVSIGAGLGVLGAGHLLGGRARLGATIAGALAGSVLGAAIGLASGKDLIEMAPLVFLGPVVGATLLYALSDASFPDPRRPAAPARRDKDEYEDEYARVLPMVTTTRTGGIIAGLVGRF